MADLDAEFDTWVTWITAQGPIHREVYRIAFRQQMWDPFAEIVEANPSVVRSGLLLEWVRDDFARSQAAAVRSQADLRRDVASLGGLLDHMARFPRALTKTRYIEDRRGSEDLAENAWLEIAAQGCDYLDPGAPAGDLEDLIINTEPVKSWVNRSVAHLSKTHPFRAVPPLDEIRSAAALIVCLFRKYHSHILNVDTTGEIAMGAWENIFRTSWEIPEEETDVFGLPLRQRSPWFEQPCAG